LKTSFFLVKQKQLYKMKSVVRGSADMKMAKKINHSFTKDCKKTGGGQAPKEPAQFDPDHEEVIEWSQSSKRIDREPSSAENSQGSVVHAFRHLTNNTVPLPSRNDDIAITHEVFQY
jgi:hypothetical protein